MGKYMQRIIKEVQILGIRDWCWFVLYLRRNEFSPKLNLLESIGKGIPVNQCVINVTKRRYRAHRIDIKLKDGLR